VARLRIGACLVSAGLLGIAGSIGAADAPCDAVLARDLAASCGACHGTLGDSAGGFAALAGAERATIVEKLKGFRAGTLPATVMHQHAKGYDDREVELLADYLSQQPRAAQR
jgi:cytochrome c553